MRQSDVPATLLAHVVRTNQISPLAMLIEYFDAKCRVRPFDAAVQNMKGTEVNWPVPAIFSRRFSKKNADYSSDFFKTNELTDFINFISKH